MVFKPRTEAATERRTEQHEDESIQNVIKEIESTSTRWVEHVGRSRASPPGKEPSVPIAYEAGWGSELVWTHDARRKTLCSCRRSNPDRPVVQSVARHHTD
jgi:hypothetical protein